MKRSLLFCTGESGGGKTTYINDKLLRTGIFYNLRSLTTRTKRKNETEGDKYFFVDEEKFNSEKLVTKLWVNEDFWTPEKPKWLYGVPEFEVYNNLGKNFVYDVIEPRYIRQMIDWFKAKKLNADYDIKIAWFIPPRKDDIVAGRANMPDDIEVRNKNTCSIHDFLDEGLRPNYILRPRNGNVDPGLIGYIGTLYDDLDRMQKELLNKQRQH